MRVREEWKQPIVSRADAWKIILLAVPFLSGIWIFSQLPTRFEHLGWAVLLLIFWKPIAEQVFKRGWRVLWTSQTLLWVGYTFVAEGSIFPQGVAAFWLSGVGISLLMAAIFDFRKSPNPVSTDTAPPAA